MGHISLAHLILMAVPSIYGLGAVIVNAYSRHQLVKMGLEKAKPSERAEILEAMGYVLYRDRWWRRNERNRAERPPSPQRGASPARAAAYLVSREGHGASEADSVEQGDRSAELRNERRSHLDQAS